MFKDIPKLGFGLMRLPTFNGDTLSDQVDIEQLKEMVDLYLERGYIYFDTAYGYHAGMSEKSVKAALTSRYPRESYLLATKMPISMVYEKERYEEIFAEQLERTGAGYFDFYLLHNINISNMQRTAELGGWEFVQQKKAEGLIKYAGFSFHDKADVLDELLTRYSDADFVQLQINYRDWLSESIQAKACYEVARKHGKGIIIMEPVKGGSLATMSEDIKQLLYAANPDRSAASWALRWCASLEGVITVLSGMSNLAQVEDNTVIMKDFEPMTDAEYKVIDEVNAALDKVPTVPCTTCRYCVEGCPSQINIPTLIGQLNDYYRYKNLPGARRSYGFYTARNAGADKCIACGACEVACPQHLKITELMQELAEIMK